MYNVYVIQMFYFAVDECICEAGSFYEPTEDCKGFIQFTHSSEINSRNTIYCPQGTAFNTQICGCDFQGSFTCPDNCQSDTMADVS